ncbi:MAG: class I tRNA ligase family protein, partial [Candidatus Aenigmarchaeota archaeon]|nr:class I tRNA ligase family protein [Candidatus Aenigmarchaeota archaeon]
ARLFLMFVSSPESQMEWSDEGIIGAYRFVLRFWSMVNESKKIKCRTGKLETRDLLMRARLHSAIKNVTETMESFRFNLTIGSLMELLNGMQKYAEDCHRDVMAESLEALTAMLSPFAPHVCEEAWGLLGRKGFVSLAKWPAADETLIDRRLEMMEELVEATKADIREVIKIVGRQPKSVSIYAAPLWKYAVYSEILEHAKKESDVKAMLKAVMQMPAARQQGRHAAVFAEKLAKDARMLKGALSQDDELKALEGARQELEKLFSCSVKIMKAESSGSLKALRAEPGKPGIEVE